MVAVVGAFCPFDSHQGVALFWGQLSTIIWEHFLPFSNHKPIQNNQVLIFSRVFIHSRKFSANSFFWPFWVLSIQFCARFDIFFGPLSAISLPFLATFGHISAILGHCRPLFGHFGCKWPTLKWPQNDSNLSKWSKMAKNDSSPEWYQIDAFF